MAMPLAFSDYQSSGPTQRPSTETPPFSPQERRGMIWCEGAAVVPTLSAKFEKSPFNPGDGKWTSYSKDYFAVSVSYTLDPWVPNARLYLIQDGEEVHQIQCFAVCLSAVVDGVQDASVELSQHTPMREEGPGFDVEKVLLPPSPPGKAGTLCGPILPLQPESETGHADTYQLTFERVQFKSATDDNGELGTHQYFRVIAELWVNVQTVSDADLHWVKIVTGASHPLVIAENHLGHCHEGSSSMNTSRGSDAQSDL